MFYHQFTIVKYSYLSTDTFRKHVERHVTWRKLALKFTGYCRQTSYTDSAVVFTLLPAVAWDLKSQFPGGYMHFNICFKGVSGKIGIFHNEKLPIEVFWFFCLSRSWQWAGANGQLQPPIASCDLTDLVVGGVLGGPAGGGGGAAPVALPGVGEVWVGAVLRHPALSLLFYFGLRDKVLESNLCRYIYSSFISMSQ